MTAILAVLASFGATACFASGTDEPPPDAQVSAVCDHAPSGPTTAPAGAVVIDPKVAGDLPAKTMASPAGTTFWLGPGTYTLGSNEFDQVAPKDGNVYLGSPGSIVDGMHVSRYAFGGYGTSVTIRYLTIQGFVAPPHEGVVNHDSSDGWLIEYNTIQNNAGAGMMAGAGQRIRRNCLRGNGQYGINAYKPGNSITGLVVEENEIVGNNSDDWERQNPGCGCTGGAKFWSVDGADIRNNWIHGNRGPGIWPDTNNNDFVIAGNLVEDNDGPAIFYETSYNAVIRDNTIRRNNWVVGREFANRGDIFPAATIYISESGGEPRIPARTDKIDIYGNILEDNWSGITLWENSDRFCHSPTNPTSDCTRLVAGPGQCTAPGIAAQPLYGDCRWKTQRVDIHHNRFKIDLAVVKCVTLCARMAMLANTGTSPTWSPYLGDVVQQAITFEQDNVWHDNAYAGEWTFMPFDTSRLADSWYWQAAPYRQDERSTFAPHGPFR